MILTAHQSTYLSWLGLFDKIARADKFCIFDDVQLERHGFENRNKIKTANGPQWLTVPIQMKGHTSRPAREVLICNDSSWARKHLRSIELAYQKAPYFDLYFPSLKEIYAREWTTLVGLNTALLKFFLNALDIRVELVTASEQGFKGSKSDLVLDMCKSLGATEYIFGAQGKDYADVQAFEDAGIKVHFQDFRHPVYNQLHGEFVPNMSAIDLLMNCGPEFSRILVGELKVVNG